MTALSSSVSIAILLRYLTRGIAAGATGSKLLLLNTIVGSAAGSCANFCNTFFMRKAEIEKGIQVFEDKELKKPFSISKICA